MGENDLIELSGTHVYRENKVNDIIKVEDGSEYSVVKFSVGEYESGLDYMLVKCIESGRYALIYQGSSGGADDWIFTNAKLAGDTIPEQLKDANNVYKELSNQYDIEVVSGNSLGGALANYTAVKSGVKSITYNSAPIPINETKSNVDITNYMSDDDVLTMAMNSLNIDGYPGNNIVLNNTIPNLSLFGANHTGYVNWNGGLSYDNVQISGISIHNNVSKIATCPWSGDILHKEYKSEAIELDLDNMTKLSKYLNIILDDKSTEAISVIKCIEEIISNEEFLVNKRIECVDNGFKGLCKNNINSKIRSTSYELDALLEEQISDEIYLTYNILSNNNFQKIINVLKVVDEIVDFFTGPIGIIGEILQMHAPHSKLSKGNIQNLDDSIYEALLIVMKLVDAFNLIGEHYLMFRSQFNNIFDLEGEKDSYIKYMQGIYNVLETNVTLVNSQIANYAKDINNIVLQMQDVEESLVNKISIDNLSLFGYESYNVDLEEIMENNLMEKKITVVDEIFNNFKNQMYDSIYQTLQDICKLLGELDESMKTVRYYKGLSKIDEWIYYIIGYLPISDNSYEALGIFGKFVDESEAILSSASNAFENLILNFDNVIEEFKPYILNSTFDNKNLQDILTLNQYVSIIYESMLLSFEEIVNQLNNNKAKSVSEMYKKSVLIINNIKLVMEQFNHASLS